MERAASVVMPSFVAFDRAMSLHGALRLVGR